MRSTHTFWHHSLSIHRHLYIYLSCLCIPYHMIRCICIHHSRALLCNTGANSQLVGATRGLWTPLTVGHPPPTPPLAHTFAFSTLLLGFQHLAPSPTCLMPPSCAGCRSCHRCSRRCRKAGPLLPPRSHRCCWRQGERETSLSTVWLPLHS